MKFKFLFSKAICASVLSFAFVCSISTSVNAAATVNAQNSSLFQKSVITEGLAEEAANSIVVSDKTQSTSRLSSLSVSTASTTSTSGTYPTRKGVILVTGDYYKGLIPTGHAAIVYNSSQVIESLSDGVQFGSNNWYSSKDTCYGVTCSSTTVSQDAGTVDYIISQGYVGLPYNYNYFNVSTRSKFYCSQLVWAAYYDSLGIDLNTSTFGAAVHPLELVNTSKTVTIYAKE
ncbi:YiiX/YebB-like N1pC/P60 family cysteine hydrolase [Anaeromicropila populeti]|uniref:Uncharacterized protein YycO n=1 Tax=Anaeromicropila populeti TaxID=37658 RepID=A0A1I6KQS0_9FIRM|nr:YiiX/YebB-like N1pC/P60 family cysteine hydrolase [Anaeromicropila populeti]SFR93595.1 Uncharacterized protein YycO [Anaeromicropila populeti]